MLSIIIPARNEEDNLEDILQYFEEGLRDIDFEVILVNDFSDDNTLEKSQKIFESNKNFKIVDNRVKGLGGAINLGIKESQGKKISINNKLAVV